MGNCADHETIPRGFSYRKKRNDSFFEKEMDIKKIKKNSPFRPVFILLVLILFLMGSPVIHAQSLNFPAKKWGISFGNSKEFTGLRFNFQDSKVERITGVNITLWKPKKDNVDAVVTGLSLGVIPGAAYLKGLNLGILGVAGVSKVEGISLGLLGVGSGGDIIGINIGGLGAGAGEDAIGINIGGLGTGAGQDLIGFNVGGFGVGAGRDLKGFNFGIFGAGGGRDVFGISIGGFGVGAGENIVGLNMGGLGVGAGKRVAGINIGGIGVGAGKRLVGLNIGGIGCGAPEVHGLTIGGGIVRGNILKGVHLALGSVWVPKGGQMTGFAASAFNYIRGTQTGLSIGIVNYAWRVKGVQIGLVNIIRDNPRGLKVLPIFNTNFK